MAQGAPLSGLFPDPVFLLKDIHAPVGVFHGNGPGQHHHAVTITNNQSSGSTFSTAIITGT